MRNTASSALHTVHGISREKRHGVRFKFWPQSQLFCYKFIWKASERNIIFPVEKCKIRYPQCACLHFSELETYLVNFGLNFSMFLLYTV
jgi:hypothetical protein